MVASYKENSGSKNSWASIYFVTRVLLNIGKPRGRKWSKTGIKKRHRKEVCGRGDSSWRLARSFQQFVRVVNYEN